jgi:ABC-2 type transport system ATP-binding protein
MEEVEQICTRIAIMDKGKKIAEGTAEELKRQISKTETIVIESVDLTDNQQLEISNTSPYITEVTFDGKKLGIKCNGGKHNIIGVLGYLQENNIPFGRISTEQPTLNDVFLEITGKELRDS